MLFNNCNLIGSRRNRYPSYIKFLYSAWKNRGLRQLVGPGLIYNYDGYQIGDDGEPVVSDSVLGPELWVDLVTKYVDENNYSEYDAETGICHIKSDGTFVNLATQTDITAPGNINRFVFEYISGTGSVKIGNTTISPQPVLQDGGVVYAPMNINTALNIRDNGMCDVYFKLSVQYCPPVPAINAGKGASVGGPWATLFQTAPTAPEVVTLVNGTKYCLQMTGTGSVSCSYGTATDGVPLFFTSTGTSDTFTPTDTDRWQLTTNYAYWPLLDPGTASTGGASDINNLGLNVSMVEYVDGVKQSKAVALKELFRGEHDGDELWRNDSAVAESGWLYLGDGLWQGSNVTGDIYVGGVTADRALFVVEIVSISAGYVFNKLRATNSTKTYTTVGIETDEIVNTVSGSRTGVRGIGFTGTLRIHSIQKLTPVPMTLATVFTMGVGSDELYGAGSTRSLFTCNSDARLQSYRGDNTVATNSKIITAYDGSNYAEKTATWDRLDKILRSLKIRYNDTIEKWQFGSAYRNLTLGEFDPFIDDDYTWKDFDGSFDPEDYLRIALNHTGLPLWLQCIVAAEGEIDGTKIMSEVMKHVELV